MVSSGQRLALAASLIVLAQASAAAEVIVLGAEGVRVAGEVAVLEVQPQGEMRVDLLVSLADEAPEERDLHVVIPLARPVRGEVDGGYTPADRFGRRHVDELTDLFYEVLTARKSREASMLTAAVAGPVSTLAMLRQSRRGVGRVRAYDRLGAMPSRGVRFRAMHAEWREELRVEDFASIPALTDLQPAEREALERHRGQPYVLVKARTKRNWRDRQGEAALWAEGLWLGFTQEMSAGGEGYRRYSHALDPGGVELGGNHPHAVFVTAADSLPLTVDFPARPRTENLPDYEKQMAYADESASWAARGRQVHMARYDQETPAGAVEIRLQEGEGPGPAGTRQAQMWRVRLAWLLLLLLGAVIWCLASVGAVNRSASAQELGLWRVIWRSWWAAHGLLLGPLLFVSWTVASVFDWRLRALLASHELGWAHVVYGLSLLVPIGLAAWSPVVLARFRSRGEGRFLLWAAATALGAGVAYTYIARAVVGWLMG
jgi:hypothetical protein